MRHISRSWPLAAALLLAVTAVAGCAPQGQAVTITIHYSAFDPTRLTVPAEAQDEAAAGESVRVTNRATKKDVIARVVDQRTVRVDF